MAQFLELSLMHQQVKQQQNNDFNPAVCLRFSLYHHHIHYLFEPMPFLQGTKSLLRKSILQDWWDRWCSKADKKTKQNDPKPKSWKEGMISTDIILPTCTNHSRWACPPHLCWCLRAWRQETNLVKFRMCPSFKWNKHSGENPVWLLFSRSTQTASHLPGKPSCFWRCCHKKKRED